jgi:hypothetical protein
MQQLVDTIASRAYQAEGGRQQLTESQAGARSTSIAATRISINAKIIAFWLCSLKQPRTLIHLQTINGVASVLIHCRRQHTRWLASKRL